MRDAGRQMKKPDLRLGPTFLHTRRVYAFPAFDVLLRHPTPAPYLRPATRYPDYRMTGVYHVTEAIKVASDLEPTRRSFASRPALAAARRLFDTGWFGDTTPALHNLTR